MTKRFKTIALLLLSLVAFLSIGCGLKGDPRFNARKRLTEIGIVYSKTAFLQRVYEGDTLAVSLFFEAGMAPNVEADFSRYLLMPDADVQRWMNGLNGRQEVWTRMIYGNSGSLGVQGVNVRTVTIPVFLVARIKAAGNSPEYREIAEMFARQGVSNEVAQLREERIRNDLRSAESDMAKAPVVSKEDKDKFFSDVGKDVQRRVGTGGE